MYNRLSTALVEGCVFEGNHTAGVLEFGGPGAGMYNSDSSPTVVGCAFVDNDAGYEGGAVTNAGGEPVIDSCVFRGNTAHFQGGAVFNSGSSPIITNCTFRGNSSDYVGGAIAVFDESAPTVTGSILWDNSPDEIYVETDADCGVSFSDCSGGFSGEGNIDADPLFVDAEGGDLHLQAGSPCIDAADGAAAPEFDIEGNERVDDPDTPNTGVGPPWADMGAYEFQP
jgi:hypothetical protein